MSALTSFFGDLTEDVHGGVAYGTLGALLHHINNNHPQTSMQPSHIQGSDLKVIATDKLCERVICSISKAAFV